MRVSLNYTWFVFFMYKVAIEADFIRVSMLLCLVFKSIYTHTSSLIEYKGDLNTLYMTALIGLA